MNDKFIVGYRRYGGSLEMFTRPLVQHSLQNATMNALRGIQTYGGTFEIYKLVRTVGPKTPLPQDIEIQDHIWMK